MLESNNTFIFHIQEQNESLWMVGGGCDIEDIIKLGPQKKYYNNRGK